MQVVIPFQHLGEHHGKVKDISVNMNHQHQTFVENAEQSENQEEDGLELFACPEECCTKVYTLPRFLEAHIVRGDHEFTATENVYDKVKKIWSEKCIAVDREYKVLVQSVTPEESETNEGWALKTSKPAKRHTKNVKEYLYKIYLECDLSGKRPNFDNLSAELKTKRNENGVKMFSRDEWLAASQIRSLFANFVKLGSPVVKSDIIENNEEINSVLREIETLEYHNDVSQLVTIIGSQLE